MNTDRTESAEKAIAGEVIGYLIEHEKEGRDFQWGPLTDADKAAGYKQTPLFKQRNVAPVEVYRVIKDVVIDKENVSVWSRRIAEALSTPNQETRP